MRDSVVYTHRLQHKIRVTRVIDESAYVAVACAIYVSDDHTVQ
jgi:hypothetical protein